MMNKQHQVKISEVAIFWDYDTLWGTDTDHNVDGSRSAGAMEFDNTDRLLDLHERYAVRACFAVVGAAALPGERPYHDPAQIRRIRSAGHEVASHSFSHEWLPALGPQQLREALRNSKDALEQCIGTSVRAFVPPYNRPFDYPAGLAFSITERTKCRRIRTGVVHLCEALCETGYELCRLGYRALPSQLVEKVLGHSIDRPGRVERIAGLSCIRLNTPCGFGVQTLAAVERCVENGGLVVVYGHPHSLTSENAQNATFLQPFLAAISNLQRSGALRVVTPSDLLERARK